MNNILSFLLFYSTFSVYFPSGVNTPLLLAAACGYENIARLLIERGADIYARNQKDHDAVFMAVVYGHASKGM